MLEPITNAEGLCRPSSKGINDDGKALCSSFKLITSKFPFNPTAEQELTLDELNSFFNAKDGKLWEFYETDFKSLVACNGSGCDPLKNAPFRVDSRFLSFFKQAVAFSRALYGNSGRDPNFHFTLRPTESDLIAEFDLVNGGEAAHLPGDGSGGISLVWPGPGDPGFQVKLKLVGGGLPQGGEPFAGLWAIFRFFADADTATSSDKGNKFLWNVREGRRLHLVDGKPLKYEFFVDAGGAPAVFSKDFLAGLKCSVPVVH